MTREGFILSWLIILLITAFDCLFVLTFKESFPKWELNPLARLIGADAALYFRVTTVLFGLIIMGIARGKVQLRGTTIVLGIHAALMVAYLV